MMMMMMALRLRTWSGGQASFRRQDGERVTGGVEKMRWKVYLLMLVNGEW